MKNKLFFFPSFIFDVNFSLPVGLLLFTILIMTSCNNKQSTSYSQNKVAIDTSLRNKAIGCSVKFQKLCNENDGITLSQDTLNKYKFSPYHTTYSSSGDSMKIAFDLNSACCMEYSGSASLSKDTLILNYFQSNKVACACYCDYRITFSITDIKHEWKNIRIRPK